MQHTGHSSPLGATVVDGGVNFSLFPRSATGKGQVFFSGAKLPGGARDCGKSLVSMTVDSYGLKSCQAW
jgi:hypothetical protein